MFDPDTSAATRRTAWLFVAGQFVLLALLVVLPAGDSWTVPDALDDVGRVARWVAIALVALGFVGLGRSLSPFPVPSEDAVLKTGGVYAVVRHPIYAGLIVLAAVWAATSGNPVTVGVAIAFAVELGAKARWEERRLIERFAGYRAYARKVGRFMPWIGRLPDGSTR